MNKPKITIFLSFFIIILLSNSFFAQTENLGELNVWTEKKVARAKINEPNHQNIGFRGVRVAKRKDFDSVIFEFKGKIPNWEIESGKSPVLLIESGTYTKIAGKALVRVNFFPVSQDSELPYQDDKAMSNSVLQISPQKLKLFFVKEIINTVWVNYELGFAVGLRTKALYRVRELSNPWRLLIDFKHY